MEAESSFVMPSICESEFWNSTLTWNTDDPRLTSCFEDTVVAVLPAVILIASVPAQISWYRSATKQTKEAPWTCLSTSKAITGGVMLAAAFLQLLYALFPSYFALTSHLPWSFAVACVARFAASIAVNVFLQMDRQRRFVSNGPLWLFSVFTVLFEALVVRARFIDFLDDRLEDGLVAFAASLYTLSAFAMLVLGSFADVGLRRVGEWTCTERECPELSSSFLGRMLFSWFTDMAALGHRRPLREEDLWSTTPENRTDKIHEKIERNWAGEIERRNRKAAQGETYKPSLVRVLIKSFWKEELVAALLKLMSDSVMFVSPQVLSALIAFVGSSSDGGGGSGAEPEPMWHGYVLAITLFLASFLQSVLVNHHFYRTYNLGMHIRTGLEACVYRKALRMSPAEKRERTLGATVNLMSVDAHRLQDLMKFVNMIWSGPLQIVLALYFLWKSLGVAAFAGVIVMVLLLPCSAGLSVVMRRMQAKLMKLQDKRMKVITEILSGIKVLKLYAWEESFQKQIVGIRRKELHNLIKQAILRAVTWFIFSMAPFAVSLVSFAAYIYLGNQLDARKAFVSLALFNILRVTLIILPMAIANTVQAQVSVARIESYLAGEEMDPDAVGELPANSSQAIVFRDASFSWSNKPEETTTLNSINLSIEEGQLVAVVGAVGAGKSSLCSALLGVMNNKSGSVSRKGDLAYVAQQAWLQNATVRENIVFGRGFNRALYDLVIDACAMRPDLAMLPAGEETEIGENGINLSGGQKQRIALARALYCRADVYILDDPLAAVDAHVGKHIFNEVLSSDSGLLKNRTRLLVTNGVGFLPKCDWIVVLRDGVISEVGTYRQLLDADGVFAAFLHEHMNDGQDETIDADELDELKRRGFLTKSAEVRPNDVVATPESKFAQKRQLRRSIVDRRQRTYDSAVLSDEGMSMEEKNGKTINGRPFGKAERSRGQLVLAETTATGSIGFHVYALLIKFFTLRAVLGTIVAYMLSTAMNVSSSIWLSSWSNDVATGDSDKDLEQSVYRLSVYSGFGGAQGVFNLLASLAAVWAAISASRKLHTSMIDSILRAPMSFFDTTPMGRVINRFSKDISTVDHPLPETMRSVLNVCCQVIAILFVVSYTTPMFLVCVPPLFFLYYTIQRYYVASARQLRRLESITRSPIFSHFQESVSGTATILAMQQQRRFVTGNEARIDRNNACFYPHLVSQRWIGVRLDCLATGVAFFAALFAVLGRDGPNKLTAGDAGLSISYSLIITQALTWLVRQTSDLETHIVAVERIKEYTDVKPEAARYTSTPVTGAQSSWPSAGRIRFDNIMLRYRPELPLVLNGITCHIEAGERIGVVGRTGAGKSSLTLALFRIVELSYGKILIDDVDIATLGLQELRSKITIIPQDPVLFSGTLRRNLDPFDAHSDADIWRALQHSGLDAMVRKHTGLLEMDIAEEGANMSVGQRQLMCLARALLRRTRVLVLDEATAAIDLETDEYIQRTIREQFSDCTVVTIAHRINTILDSSRVMVLHEGRVVEFAPPQKLLEDEESAFHKLCRDANVPMPVGGEGKRAKVERVAVENEVCNESNDT